jgi:hypothetical protein
VRNGIVEGDDFSMLPVPMVRFVNWLGERLGKKPPSDPDGDDTTR